MAETASPQIAGPNVPPTKSAMVSRGKRKNCHQCCTSPMGLEGARAYALYDDHLRKVVLAFKYKGLRVLAASLGELMARSWPTLAPSDRGIDVVVPVPLHRARERARGFNQAALLSRHLAAWIRRPVVEDALLRTKPTSPQVGLSPEERRKNVDGAFQCITGSLAGQRVLLVDDVYTTGSTLEAARAALHGAGVRSVWAYTLARADSPPSS